MMEKIFIFIIFLCPLVFFHELGHYLFARLFGVRVEVFSIGFGPKLIKFVRGETQYALSLIPLGGYVKMFGDDLLKKDEVPIEERKKSFVHQGKWARFWIVMGGPLANFILSYFIFFGLILAGEKRPELRIGYLPEKSVLYTQGMRSGDIITKVNQKEITGPTDLPTPGDQRLTQMTVDRFGKYLKLKFDLSAKEFFEEFTKNFPYLEKPIVINSQGQRFILSIGPDKVDENISLEQFGHIQSSKIFFFPMIGQQKNQNSSFVSGLKPSFSIKKDYQNFEQFLEWLADNKMRPLALAIKSIKMNGPADKSKLRKDDVIVQLNGKDILTFGGLKTTLQKSEGAIRLGVWKEGELKTFSMTPTTDTLDGKKVKILGIISAAEYLEPNFVEVQGKGLLDALGAAWIRTGKAMLVITNGIKKLVSGDVSFKQVGGPLKIGKVASDSFHIGISSFFQLMALISVNLGIINLLPIPVLDGGHIMFILLEIANRGPLSRKKMQFAQQIGLSLLLLLMVGAIFNDFSWILSK